MYCYGVTGVIINVLYTYVFNKACNKHYSDLTRLYSELEASVAQITLEDVRTVT